MAFEYEKRTYRMTGITPILGSQPADPEIRTKYIASRAPSTQQMEEEADYLPEESVGNGVTVFLKNQADQAICLMDYMIVAFFKESIKSLSAQTGVLQARSKCDQFLFAEPRLIPITREGEIITERDRICERTLRATTMQGDRTALAASEQIDAPWQVEFTLMLIDNAGTAKSKPLTWEAIETALDYGALHGLGQWRNGGYGRFTWEKVEA